MKFPNYKAYHLHAYIDTGASICVAHENVIPRQYWKPVAQQIHVQIADKSVHALKYQVDNVQIKIAGEVFVINRIYQQNTNMDILIGNNFLNKYYPFVQYPDYILLHIDKQSVHVQKEKQAFRNAQPGFTELYRKRNRGDTCDDCLSASTTPSQCTGCPKLKPPVNISPNGDPPVSEISCVEQVYPNTTPDLDLVDPDYRAYVSNLQALAYLEQEIQAHIEEQLKRVSSENPLDKNINKLLADPARHAEIRLIDPTKVIKVKPMTYSPGDRQIFNDQIKELLDMQVIRPSKSPHSSPAFLVENHSEIKRGKKRMVVNYKQVNKHTISDGYYLPKKEDLFRKIRGKTVYSSFDCKSGFWQIPLQEQCRCITAFSCPSGQFEWNVVPFGLKQAPGLFQRYIDDSLELKNPNKEIHKYCIVYVDDILVFSNNEQEHVGHVMEVLKLCEDKGIVLSFKKAQIAQQKVNFLGLEIENGTHTVQDHVLNKIREFPSIIGDKTQLQRFLGCLTYVEGYIPQLAKMRKPLQAKLKKDVVFKWSKEDTDYVDKIKKQFTTLPKLYHPLEEDYMILETDASNDHWGAVLKARDKDNVEQICRYTSGAFQGSELNYHSQEKETLAVKKGIKKFAIYLITKEFTVRTDNKNFGYFLRTEIAGDYKQGRLLRWQQWFNHYQFRVEYIKGEKNVIADALTREWTS